MATKAKDQLALDEKAVKDDDLEAALEKRLRARDDLAEVRGVFEAANTEAQGLIEKHNLAVGDVLRIGRFRIEKTQAPPRDVSFSTEAKERVKIALIEE